MIGNQLIPVHETRISIRKEVLTLRKVNNTYIEVTVDYEFYNPDDEREIIVGFEAARPSGDADIFPKNGEHPYMHDFSVRINNQNIPYKIAYAIHDKYTEEGNILSHPLDNLIKDYDYDNDVVADFLYVYHFKANFKKGTNRIIHTYRYDVSSSVDYLFYFEYILTAANRWANQQIDDFTLIIELDNYEDFYIDATFFKDLTSWNIIGKGFKNIGTNPYTDERSAYFIIPDGKAVFMQKNFKPQKELYVYQHQRSYGKNTFTDQTDLPFNRYQHPYFENVANTDALKILQNLPYARRGYRFKNAMLSEYYSSQVWYVPDEEYVPEPEKLSPAELKWLQSLNRFKN